jgi:glucose-6-phosphate isomerase
LPGPDALNEQSWRLPADSQNLLQSESAAWQEQNKTRRLWARDATLWTGGDEAAWLGWLDLTSALLQETRPLAAFAEEVKREGFSHAVLLGMGGSSLCPEVLSLTFGPQPDFPRLKILDSTVPAQVIAVERRVRLDHTLFIVASKSGTTVEPNIFLQYFFERVRQSAGNERAGRQFVAITDPGSKMQQVAERDKFRRIFFGIPSVGGRYSALSNFGLVPAAVMGLDVQKFLASAHRMAKACGAEKSVESNPGVALGILLGVLARQGRDKLTIFTTPLLFDLGAWLEQLIAESTGKDGNAILPVDREPVAAPEMYGHDRVFVYLRFIPEKDDAQSAAISELERAGHPVIRIALRDVYDLGQEFFRWEIATAVAGSLLGVNPFNQPDVEASKVETRKLTAEFEARGALPAEEPFFREGEIRLFADEANRKMILEAAGSSPSLASCLRAHLARLTRGDYFALLAYLEMNAAHEHALQEIRALVRERFRVATCLGFGPRFLHSTGQAYKGGPNTGVFLQITCDDAADLPVPGQKFTFGVVKAAQARGDFEVLAARQRRALRIHLGKDVPGGLRGLVEAVKAAGD